MKKVRSLSKEKIDEISALIGASFWDYPYAAGEGGLKPFYSTDSCEGYILITDTKGNHPNFRSIIKMTRRMLDEMRGLIMKFDKQANETGNMSANYKNWIPDRK